jgi:deazaflavin-dependent oxidoreductase (nitroreductase family)
MTIPPNGTYGARAPTGRAARFGTAVIAWLYRMTGGAITGHQALLLATIGARTGERRTASLRRFDDGPGRWLVVASNNGAAKQPAWVINLVRHPDQASVVVDRDTFRVTPELLEGAERDAAWRRIVTDVPRFGAYKEKTDREMPVVRLTRVG